ncbi:MAG: hypothetical protein BWZ07_02521 [Alphaproteobacteria bacterium ADurb.BinA280]|nr:MAG: hypothetical protein BWZ07_02521 [Alphaproteobacteria bacterium ADurb.BinA280]
MEYHLLATAGTVETPVAPENENAVPLNVTPTTSVPVLPSPVVAVNTLPVLPVEPAALPV